MSKAIQFEIFTLFPEVFKPYLQTSIINRATQGGLVSIELHNIREWTSDRHHVTDDLPYGGGGGMVMKPEPVFAAVEGVLGSPPECPVVLLTPQGRIFNQSVAKELLSGSAYPDQKRGHSGGALRLALICGRYEGVDERIRRYLVDDEISIGDYVLTGGELAAMVVIDTLTRLIPGALGDPEGAQDDSHASGLLEYPHYTRPKIFRDWSVPEVLLSGDHAKIDRWRREQSLLRTWIRRPELLEKATLTSEDVLFLESLRGESNPTSMGE